MLALIADLFDGVPPDQMTTAEQAVVEAATKLAAEVIAHFETADELCDEDRQTIIELARQALDMFASDMLSKVPNQVDATNSTDNS